MDYGALPPEINSARMYSGPGSAPMMAAATAWAALGAELGSTAASYDSVISGLTSEEWMGPASASMAAAADPYVTWMNVTGTLAQQTSAQAAAAAAAYEAAFAMTVPPAEVAANRSLLAALVATNFLGQNTPAIAATEAQYGEMWAQDAAAMYGYAGSSAAASTLTPFDQPAETTNPAGPGSQASAVTQATGSAAGTGAQTVDQLMSAIPTALQGLSSPLSAAANSAAFPGQGILASLLNFLDGADGNAIGTFLNSSFVNGFVSAGYVSPAIIEPAVTAGMSDINAVAVSSAPGATALPPMGSGAGNPGWLPLLTPGAAAGVPGVDLGEVVSAGTNQAVLVGRLSVPQSWTAAAQVANHAGAALPGGGWTGIAGPAPGTAEAVPAGAPGMPGMPAVGVGGYHYGSGPRYGFRPTIIPRPPAAG
jgi:PPE-repeat protein